jgi:hypothetical protein
VTTSYYSIHLNKGGIVVPLYDSSITRKKGAEGGLEGAVVGAISAVVIGLVKKNINDLPPEVENGVAVGVGIGVGAVVLGVKRLIANWKKHRNK